MKYFCNHCERVIDDSEIYQTVEKQTLEYWGKPITEEHRTNHCCYCDSDKIECLETNKTVYTVNHKVENAIIVSRPFYTEDDANEHIDFLKSLGKVGSIKEWH